MPPGSDERQIGIIPNGHTTYSEKNNLRYLRLVRKYSSIIQGQFFGHLHSDSFRIVYNDMGKTCHFFPFLCCSSLNLHPHTHFHSYPFSTLLLFILVCFLFFWYFGQFLLLLFAHFVLRNDLSFIISTLDPQQTI